MENNNYNLLKNICEKIEKLSKEKHIEILKILKKDKINITENNNGCFINMNTIDDTTIKNIEKYVSFLKHKEKELSEQEIKKNSLLSSLNDLDK
jgi:hypothetical protein